MNLVQISFIASGVILMSACAPREKEHIELFQVDSTFLPYVQNFELAAMAEGKDMKITDLIVSFGDTPSMNETGVCEIADNETPRVTINQKIWNTLSNTDRQEVIFHELGHCVLRRRHQNSEMWGFGGTTKIPESIMYPYRIPGTTYQAHIAHYHDELFSKTNEF